MRITKKLSALAFVVGTSITTLFGQNDIQRDTTFTRTGPATYQLNIIEADLQTGNTVSKLAFSRGDTICVFNTVTNDGESGLVSGVKTEYEEFHTKTNWSEASSSTRQVAYAFCQKVKEAEAKARQIGPRLRNGSF